MDDQVVQVVEETDVMDLVVQDVVEQVMQDVIVHQKEMQVAMEQVALQLLYNPHYQAVAEVVTLVLEGMVDPQAVVVVMVVMEQILVQHIETLAQDVQYAVVVAVELQP